MSCKFTVLVRILVVKEGTQVPRYVRTLVPQEFKDMGWWSPTTSHFLGYLYYFTDIYFLSFFLTFYTIK